MASFTQIGALVDFTAGTTIVSADVDSNFSAIRTVVNQLITGSNTINVDTITEVTSAGGVTIDSVVLKDGGITVSAAILPNANDGAALGSASVSFSDLFLASGAIISFANSDVTLTHSSGTLAMSPDKLLIGDTVNANMTVGLTINQGAATNQAFAIKNQTTHGLTTAATTPVGDFDTEADDHFAINAVGQCTNVRSVAADGNTNYALNIESYGGVANTTKSTSGIGLMRFYVSQHDGANALADLAANGNAYQFVCRKGAADATIFIIDEDGDFHYDGADGGAFDSEDDVALVRAFALATSKDVIRTDFDEFVRYNEDDLVRLGILGDRVENGGLVNGAQLQRLLVGAVWQQAQALEEMRAEIKALTP